MVGNVVGFPAHPEEKGKHSGGGQDGSATERSRAMGPRSYAHPSVDWLAGWPCVRRSCDKHCKKREGRAERR